MAPKIYNDKWIEEIVPKRSLFHLNLKELYKYKDLLFLFVRRDIVTVYKQTILGPLWYFIQPLLMSLIFTLIFNKMAGIDTKGINSFLFNLAGITVWNYFASCMNETSDTFKKNEAIFGKIYFPRAIMPISVMISNLVKFLIQLILFISIYIYFYSDGVSGTFSWHILLLPFFILLMGLTGLGLGMIISSLTTKYRDLTFLIQFGIQLLMYISAVMYPISLAKEQLGATLSLLVTYNPLAVLIENTREIVFFNGGNFNLHSLIFPVFSTLFILLFGLLIFNKTERSFIDTI